MRAHAAYYLPLLALCLVGMLYLVKTYHTCQPINSPSTITQSFSAPYFEPRLDKKFPETRRSVVHEQQFQPRAFSLSRNSSFDYKAAMRQLNEEKVDQEDPRLIKLIRDYYIVPPSSAPYNLDSDKHLDYSIGQAPFVDSRLNHMEGGFYIECGALDGERGSNTLFFEKVRKWNGVLIEGDPTNFEKLKRKNRKAFLVNGCLNTETHPSEVLFNKAFNMGRMVQDNDADEWIKNHRLTQNKVKVQCFPITSILLALNQTTVDFFSLDVEGDELGVLKTIPFDKINIKMMTVEFVHEKGGTDDLNKFVQRQGYDNMLKMSRWDGRVNDIIFRKKGLSH